MSILPSNYNFSRAFGLLEHHCKLLSGFLNRKQYCCIRPECRRARKANLQRIKMRTHPDYRPAQKLSQRKWVAKNPDYWKTYRDRNPEKTERNRILQTLRNRRGSTVKKSDDLPIAKVDVRINLDFQPVEQFWLVPLIAKMDFRTKSK